MTLLLIFLGGVVGAPARYLLDRLVSARVSNRLPYGTLTANLLACLILGLLVGTATRTHIPHDLYTFVDPGLCGALSTFSTFSSQTFQLLEEGEAGRACVNAFGSLVLGVLVVAGAYTVASNLF